MIPQILTLSIFQKKETMKSQKFLAFTIYGKEPFLKGSFVYTKVEMSDIISG